MSNLPSTTFASANLPAVSSLSSALREIKTNAGGSDSGVIMKMDKTGHWVFGADQTEVEDDARWAVNPFSFVHGFIAWGDGEPLGEKMVPVTEPLPECGPAPDGAKKGWETQVGCSLKCMTGEDKDMEVRYLATSVGGKKALQTLALAIATQVDKDQSKPVPLVLLKKDQYQHKSYGRIYTPVFDIIEWVGLDGDEAQAVADEVEPEPDTATRRRRRG